MGIKISELESTTTANANDVFIINQNGATKKITKENLANQIINPELEERVDVLEEEVETLQTKVANLEETVNSELEDGTATGTEITVNDSAVADASLDIEGNTSQKQTNGYQLFDKDTVSIVLGSLGSEGQEQSSTTRARTSYIDATAGETYIISSTNTRLQVVPYYYDNSNNFVSYDSGWKSLPFSYTVPTGASKVRFIFKNSQTNTINITEITNLMLEEGTTVHDWEEYSGGQASPSPDYPQDVHILKGSNTIKVCNKNLCELELGGIATGNGQNTESRVYARTKNYIPVNELEYITAQYQRSDNSQVVIFEYDENKNFINFSFANGIVKTTQVGAHTRYVRARFQGDSQGPLSSYQNVQVEYGSTATDYEPHKEQVKTLTLPNGLEMCGIEDSRDEFVKDLTTGKWYKNKKVNKKIINQFSSRNNTSISGKYRFNNTTINNGLACDTESNLAYCDKLKLLSRGTTYVANNTGFTIVENNQVAVYIEEISEMTLEEANIWLTENLLTFYYPLATPILEEITDTTLIAELDELLEIRTYYGQTNITVEAEDLPPMMTLNYKKSNRILRSEIDTIKARLDLLEN